MDRRTSEDFDTFEPIACDQLVLEIGDLETVDFVN